MKAKRIISLLALVLILCTALCLSPASAHRVYVREQVNEVQIKAWYGGGAPMAYADVTIYANSTNGEELYLEGATDENGIFHFTPRIGISKYRVVVEATGHRAEEMFDLMGGGSQETAELPLFARMLAGFGYLAGLAGIGMLLAARKLNKRHTTQAENKVNPGSRLR
ncbi:MAG: carboxypeptidase regulatory-like domain-containing protein [Methanosarcinales archaeon]|nr:MAG: carboxypeptidase regulatory-like domain-containing protein [Methanosarcinales archaeon]